MFGCFFVFYLEVCVDKARADEYEQRALELEQKVSDFFLSSYFVTFSLSALCSSLLIF